MPSVLSVMPKPRVSSPPGTDPRSPRPGGGQTQRLGQPLLVSYFPPERHALFQPRARRVLISLHPGQKPLPESALALAALHLDPRRAPGSLAPRRAIFATRSSTHGDTRTTIRRPTGVIPSRLPPAPGSRLTSPEVVVLSIQPLEPKPAILAVDQRLHSLRKLEGKLCVMPPYAQLLPRLL